MSRPGLGRLAAPDPRDRGFLLRAALPETVVRKTRYWPNVAGPLDQGQTGTCVGHGWKGWMLTAPVVQTKPQAEPTAFTLYREATHVDEWDGNEDDLQSGTSVRAGAKAVQAHGYLTSYGWAWDVDTIIDWLCVRGPAVLGMAWPEAFFDPDAGGVVHWPQGGSIAGGHCFLSLGWDQKRGRFRCLNSWGPRWGQRGRFWIDGETMERLLAADGECCTSMEVKRA